MRVCSRHSVSEQPILTNLPRLDTVRKLMFYFSSNLIIEDCKICSVSVAKQHENVIRVMELSE